MTLKALLLRNSTINVGSYAYLLLASFWAIAVLLSNLGADKLGLYLLIITVVPLASVLDLGTGIAIIRKLSMPDTSESEKLKTWQGGMFFAILRALGLFVGVILLYWGFGDRVSALDLIDSAERWRIVVTVALMVLVDHVNVAMLSLPQAKQDFVIFNIKTFVVGTTNTVISALVTFGTQDISVILLAQLTAHLITNLILVIYTKKIFGIQGLRPANHPKQIWQITTYGLKNFVGTLASQLEAQVSKIVLGTYISAGSVAAFSIPQSIVQKGAAVVSQVAQVMLPLGTSLLSADRVDKLQRTVWWIQGGVLASGLAAIWMSVYWGEAFLSWWLRDTSVVQTVVPILKLFSVYYLFTSLTPIPTVLMQSINKPQIPSMFALLTLSVEIILLILLVPSMQLMGVVYATVGAAILAVPPFLITTQIIFDREARKIKSR